MVDMHLMHCVKIKAFPSRLVLQIVANKAKKYCFTKITFNPIRPGGGGGGSEFPSPITLKY